MEELENHQYWMNQALIVAKEAGNRGDIPVGAIVVDNYNNLIAKASNQKELQKSAIAHAEILAINQANQKLGKWRLDNCTLYVTLEPCPMCIGAIIQARIKTLVYGVDDFKTGAVRTILNIPDSEVSNHRLQVFAGIQAVACGDLLQSWFNQLRQGKRQKAMGNGRIKN